MNKTTILLIAAFAMASAAVAQTEAKESTLTAKQVLKQKKAQEAADLKAFKQKQKAELEAFVKAQKQGKDVAPEKPTMVTSGDSLAYLFGIAQSNGLKDYAIHQLGVEEVYLIKFAEGILARAEIHPTDKAAAAVLAGQQIGERVVGMTNSFSKDYYAADKDQSISPSIVANGLVAGLLGTNDVPADSAGTVFQQQMKQRIAQNNETLYGANRLAGEQFLDENKIKEGVVTTASGLQYRVLTMGTGEKPTATQTVIVDYEGRLVDGTVFDSSYERGEPASFAVNQVIAGWTEALQLMPEGSKWELFIPYQLAYGEQETGVIKPYSALFFTVELKGIKNLKDIK